MNCEMGIERKSNISLAFNKRLGLGFETFGIGKKHCIRSEGVCVQVLNMTINDWK